MVLQGFQVMGVISTFPAVESLRRDAEVAASEASIFSMRVIVIKPFKSVPGFFDSAGTLARHLYPGISLYTFMVRPL